MLKQLTYSDLQEFCKKLRRVAFESTLKVSKKKFKSPSEEVIDDVISIREVSTILLDEFSLETTDKYIVLDNDYTVCQLMLNSVINRLVSNELNRMVNDGVLDCGFDDDTNDFFFIVVKEE